MTPNEFAEKQYEDIKEAARLGAGRHSIRDFRNILEAVFKHLTLSERRLFVDLYARIEYVFRLRSTDSPIREQVHGLRKLANQYAHQLGNPTTEDWMLCLRAIAETVSHFYDQDIPEDISQIYAQLGQRRLMPKLETKGETVDYLKVAVLSAEQVVESDGKRYFDLICMEEDLGECSLRLWDSAECNLTLIRPLLTRYCTLLLTNCRKSGSEQARYTSTKDSLAILEPDLLIDVSDLAKCFVPWKEDSTLFLTGKLMPSRMALPMFKGSIVNSVLDGTVRADGIGFEEAYDLAVRDNFLTGTSFQDAALEEVRKEVRIKHWPNILQITEKLRGRPTRIEPSFLSDTYGLQGRLDLMVESAADPLRNDVFELKSGSPPLDTQASKAEHSMQVVGYNLLLDSVFQGRRHGSSAVIYSSADNGLVRGIVPVMKDKSRLMSVRNQVVASLIRMAKDDPSVIDELARHNTAGMPSFVAQSFQAFGMDYKAAGKLRQGYYKALLSFMVREYLDMKCGLSVSPEREDKRNGFASLWLETVEDKVRNFSAIASLNLDNFDKERSRVNFRTSATSEHNFRVGDPVIIHGRSEESVSPMRQQVVKGRIESIDGESICISLNNSQIDGSHFNAFPEWVIEHDIFESTHWNVCRLLYEVLKPGRQDRFERLAGIRRPVFSKYPDIDASGLNENQVGLIRSALAANDYFLVQGPPGTGKTSTFLTRLVEERLKRPGSIAVVAFTNRAVDEIAERLTDRGLPFERLGGRKAQSAEMQAFMENSDIKGARGFLAARRVFLATVATMTSQLDLLRQLREDLDTLIVDEASQLDEAKLAGMLLAFDKFILIGDQNQLPPIVTQDERLCMVQDPQLTEMGMRNLSESIFERLMRHAKEKGWDDSYGMLDTQYRMHNQIAALIEPWYGNRLRSGHIRQTDPGPGWPISTENNSPWQELLCSGRSVFVPSTRCNTAKYHEVEAARITSVLRHMQQCMGDAFDTDSVGVVTPWRTQISKIRERIGSDPRLEQVLIDTVERFQGSEKDRILVSFAVCHPGQMSILRTPGSFSHLGTDGKRHDIEIDRKLLVTLSRARQQVIVFGDEEILNTDPIWASIISRMARHQLPDGL